MILLQGKFSFVIQAFSFSADTIYFSFSSFKYGAFAPRSIRNRNSPSQRRSVVYYPAIFPSSPPCPGCASDTNGILAVTNTSKNAGLNFFMPVYLRSILRFILLRVYDKRHNSIMTKVITGYIFGANLVCHSLLSHPILTYLLTRHLRQSTYSDEVL